MDQGSLFLMVIAGAFGTGYFIYGWKQKRGVALLAGIGLTVAPFVVDALWGQLLICVACAVAPFLWQV